MNRTLFTIGFTRKSAERFFGLLNDAGVRCVLDIRARPDSQLAGFARARDLAWFLGAVSGIRYAAVPALSPANSLLADYRAGRVEWAQYEARYLGSLSADAVHGQLAGIDLDGACLLCSEDDSTRCHRRLAAEWLSARQSGLLIRHLK